MLDLTTQGVFSWNELLTKDVEAARKFYTEVLGWTAAAFGSRSGPYDILSLDSGRGAVW